MQLKKVTASDAGSEQAESDICDGIGFPQNPATVEYFAPAEPFSSMRSKRITKNNSSKNSIDFYSLNLGMTGEVNTGP